MSTEQPTVRPGPRARPRPDVALGRYVLRNARPTKDPIGPVGQVPSPRRASTHAPPAPH